MHVIFARLFCCSTCMRVRERERESLGPIRFYIKIYLYELCAVFAHIHISRLFKRINLSDRFPYRCDDVPAAILHWHCRTTSISTSRSGKHMVRYKVIRLTEIKKTMRTTEDEMKRRTRDWFMPFIKYNDKNIIVTKYPIHDTVCVTNDLNTTHQQNHTRTHTRIHFSSDEQKMNFSLSA